MTDAVHYRSKTTAAWLAVLGGTLGLHRFYLYGLRDGWAWLHLPPTLIGLGGIVRMRNIGQDDQAAWLLSPLFGVMVSVAMLTAIIYGLTPDEKWDAERNPGQPPRNTAWGPVLAAVAALLVGGGAFMGTVAFSGQKFFEWQYADETAARNNSRPGP